MIRRILLAFLNFLLILTIITQCQAQSETTCKTIKSESGTCKILKDCQEIVNLIRRQKKDYTVCSRDPLVVCCPEQNEDKIVQTNNQQGKRIHEIKCTEYSEAVFELQQTVLLLLSQNIPKKIDKCGNENIPLIMGGIKAGLREFPHMALIGYLVNGEKQWNCGGTLISDEYVLTAGHCLKSPLNGHALYVRLGESDLSRHDEDSDTEDFDIIKRIPHPFYNTTSLYFDIALVQLDRKVKINPYKRPACLPTLLNGPELQVIVTGWGLTESGEQSNALQKVILNKFDGKTCNEIYTNNPRNNLKLGIDEKTQFCAGSSTEKKDSCTGDSGGPVQVFHPTEYCMYTVIGITSFGSGLCAQIGIPGVYTRIFRFVDWIESIVWK